MDVDNIYEYLLVKGVEVASIHGGKGELQCEFRCFSIGNKLC